jgi:ABC-type bacteriocin/lantibiotic exporter with double-glycine peptidase domain
MVSRDEFSRSFTGVAVVLEPGVDFEAVPRGRSRLWRAMRQVLDQSGLLTQVIVTTGTLQILGLALPILTGLLVDRVIPRGDSGLLVVIGVGAAGVTIFQLLTSLVRSFLLLQLRTQLDARMGLDFLDHLVRLPLAFLQLRPTGDLMLRMNSNTVIREALTSAALSGVLDGAAVLGYMALLLIMNWPIGLLALGLATARILIFIATRQRMRDLSVEGVLAQSGSASYQVQLLEGIEAIKAAGAEPRAVENWSNLFVEVLNVSVRTERVQAWIDAAIGALNLLSPLLILSYGGFLVISGHLSLGAMLALSAMAAGFLTPVSSLTRTAIQLQTLGSYVRRVEDVLQQPQERSRADLQSSPRLAGRVVLENVSFSYSSGGPWAVSHVELEIRPGERIAVVGRSGCGKSTLARLLMGLYTPTEGRVLYDGHDLAQLEPQGIRRQIGFVPQSPYLFGASVRANIALRDPQSPLEDVERAAQIAAIHDEVMRWPLGYETPLLAGGGSISGGQRQRLALARALMGAPAILILDEATSHLDALTERHVHENLRPLPITQIIIAHRFSTVQDADRVLVIEDGRIVEQGTPVDLLRRDSAYARLVAGQRYNGAPVDLPA